MARGYVGVNYDDTALPGVVVIRRDGRVAYRQIATTKDDRLTSAQVLAAVDRALGTHGDDAHGGYTALARAQLRVDAGVGTQSAADRSHTIATSSIAGFVPLGRHVLVGPWLGLDTRAGAALAATDRRAGLDLDAALVLRLPVLADTGAVQLTAFAGWTPPGSGWNAGVRAGPWLAWQPTYAVHLEVGVALHELGDVRATEATVSLGLGKLIQIR